MRFICNPEFSNPDPAVERSDRNSPPYKRGAAGVKAYRPGRIKANTAPEKARWRLAEVTTPAHSPDGSNPPGPPFVRGGALSLRSIVKEGGCSIRSSPGLSFCVTAIVFFAFLAAPCPAQDQDAPDKVIINPGGRASTRVTLKGEIVEYTGETLRIRLKPGESPKEYPASDVVEILTPQISGHQKGLELFNKSDFPTAEKAFRAAFDDEGRPWVKREILTYLIRCALMQGDYVNATSKFAILVRSDSRTQSFPLIPLVWSQQQSNSVLKSQGEAWLLDDKQPPAIRLMGASILLEDPQFGTTATVALRDLAAQSDRRVGVLAACQQWRLRLATRKEVNLTELKAWQQKIDSLPEELRAGPHYLMGRAYVSRREFELGAVHLLWTPLVQPEDHFLASRATLEAADALVTIGQLEAGARLYEEIAARFGDTPSAQEAASQLKELLKQENAAEGKKAEKKD